MTLDDSKTWRKKKSPSKPKLSDHATHLLTDSSQSPGQGHSSCARPLGRDPRESNLSLFIAPSPVRERGPVATGWQTTAPSTCDSVCPHCQKKSSQGFSAAPLGRADVGRALETLDTQVHHWAAPPGSPAEEMSPSQRFMEPE